MHITVWGINYSPELTGIAPYNVALCEFLHEKGHDVRMVTTFCYYPAWQKLPTEKNKVFRTDNQEDVTVHRCWHYVPKLVTPFKRILHELTFVASSILRQLFLPKPDLMIVVSPPLLLGFAAWLLSVFKSAPFIFHIQDLQPDAAAALGLVKDGWFLKVLRWCERFAYQKAAAVSGISQGILDAVAAKGIPSRKCIYFPNGITIPNPEQLPGRGSFRARHSMDEDDFVVLYSGNMGVKQGLGCLIEAAAQVKNPKVHFVLCGDGAIRHMLEVHARALGLENVHFIPLQPEHRYREMMMDADLCVIPQQAGTGKFFFPSKLLSALSFSRPILSVSDSHSEVAHAVGEGAFGVNVAPNDARLIAETIETLAANRSKLSEYSQAAGQFIKRFDQETVLNQFYSEMPRPKKRVAPEIIPHQSCLRKMVSARRRF
jgi:colanic acid biosynthesis glycosyl transferase WcaI